MKINEINLNDYFDEYGVYDLEEVLDNLDLYLGIGKKEIIMKLCSSLDVIGVDMVCKYCRENFDSWSKCVRLIEDNVDDFIKNRIVDYDFLLSKYNIYKKKGLQLLNLIDYIVISGKYKTNSIKHVFDDDMEKYLDTLGICHKNSVVVGKAVIAILFALGNLISELDNIVLEINNLDGYQMRRFDWLAIKNKSKVLPSESLIYDEDRKDKTSVKIIKKSWK